MSKLKKIIPYSCQYIDEDDFDEVKKVLNSKFLTQGPKVDEFEKAISHKVKSKFGIACNSATSVLHLGCMALGIGKKDIVWTVPNSFVASANCALYCGAKIDFVDIDPITRNISLQLLEEKLDYAKIKNQLPKLIIPVHFSGNPVNMKQLNNIVKKFGDIKLIEDASHALGAYVDTDLIGSCKYSDLTVFSFHPVKMITTAEGGVLTTNNKNLYNKLCNLRSHGIERLYDKFKLNNEINDHPIYYEQQELGFNYRMPDLLATLGLSQLKKLNVFLNKRNKIANFYSKKFKNTDLKIPRITNNSKSSYHLYVLEFPKNRNSIIKYLRNLGIMVSIHYIPIHYHPYYQSLGFNYGDFINSENYYKNCLSIPIYPSLSLEDQEYVADTILNLL